MQDGIILFGDPVASRWPVVMYAMIRFGDNTDQKANGIMMIEKINSPYSLGLNVSPNVGDVAIAPINDSGSPGALNSMVLAAYGLTTSHLPGYDKLKRGYALITDGTTKPIILIVTISNNSTSQNLENNLFGALIEFNGLLNSRTVWLPLMGTGEGGLTLLESYNITAKVINLFLKKSGSNAIFHISIPDTKEGKKLINQISVPDNKDDFSIEEAEILSKSLKSKLYLVGTIWDRQDQMPRFLEEGIWETGYGDDRYGEIISRVKKNDILLLKSTFQSNSVSYLRIKGFGLVKDTASDGVSLQVDWRERELSIDIEDLGFYRHTINEVSPRDVVIILSRIDRQLWPKLNPIINSVHRKESIAGLLNDSDKGVDYLNIEKDVNAFAKVIAAKSYDPPLAIALFGKWGSGKSFFMRELKDRIVKLSDQQKDIYCTGVAHIHFNAWSYMDCNLWASVVTKIFEELNHYISDNSLTEKAKKDIEQKLTNELSISKEEIAILENKKQAVAVQIITLTRKKDNLNDELNSKINQVKTNSLSRTLETINREFRVHEKISAALEENQTFNRSIEELKDIIPEKYWSSPEKSYEIAKSRLAFIKEFFRRDIVQKNLICLVIILLIIAFAPIILDLISSDIGKTNFLIPQSLLMLLTIAGAIWRRAEKVYNELQPVIASFWKIKEEYEQKVNEAVAKFEQEEKALNLEIDKSKSEILLIKDQIQKAEATKVDLEFRISNALATEALYSFIDRRSKSEDYKKHLGIISIIRKDFEILNNLFIDHNNEAEKMAASAEFKSKFKKPLERIVLYIDDLDRCPEENVVQVLEAVNLLMAFPLFVVVVGVDSRWVKNALIKKHAHQFYGTGSELKQELETIDIANYLEKIFQIPFHLKPASDQSVKGMIRKLAESKASIGRSDYKVKQKQQPDGRKQNEDPNSTEHQSLQTSVQTTVTTNDGTIVDDTPEALIFTVQEIEMMEAMSEIIGNNPRAVKRFVNIYRVIKAHEEFNYVTDKINEDILSILFLLALPLGRYKTLLKTIEEFISNEKNSTKQLSLFTQITNNENLIENLKSDLNRLISDNKMHQVLQAIPVTVLRHHNEFTRRFTFNPL